tara:strand:- start:132 stop:395 length:264 start_codon:yes stop_codon:yes gene_type:complete
VLKYNLNPITKEMAVFNVIYQRKLIQVKVDEPEITVKRLKNNILGKFERITYDNLKVFMVEDENVFSLDDNEIVDEDMSFILEINSN